MHERREREKKEKPAGFDLVMGSCVLVLPYWRQVSTGQDGGIKLILDF